MQIVRRISVASGNEHGLRRLAYWRRHARYRSRRWFGQWERTL